MSDRLKPPRPPAPVIVPPPVVVPPENEAQQTSPLEQSLALVHAATTPMVHEPLVTHEAATAIPDIVVQQSCIADLQLAVPHETVPEPPLLEPPPESAVVVALPSFSFDVEEPPSDPSWFVGPSGSSSSGSSSKVRPPQPNTKRIRQAEIVARMNVSLPRARSSHGMWVPRRK
jgi:hypothetical protein